MNKKIEHYRISYLLSQRNILGAVSALLLGIVTLQAIFLFFRNERIIISPPELHQSYWVEGNRFSEGYLEEMAAFYAHLLLDVSADTLLYQGEVALRAVDADSYSRIRTKLFADEKKLKKENVTSRFEPKKAIVSRDALEVQLKGTMTQFVSGKQVTSFEETFIIRFSAYKGKLFIKDFALMETKNKKFDDDAIKNQSGDKS
jgi:conjugal transfer pilus assembly protein TraE